MGHVMRARWGFTLIETLLVVLVVTILASIVIPKLMGAAKEAKEANLRSTLQQFRSSIALFRSHTGGCPVQLADLMAPGNAPPVNGLDDSGAALALNAGDYQGPYMTPSLPAIPINAVTGGNAVGTDWLYSTTPPNVGQVRAAVGIATDGSNYSTW